MPRFLITAFIMMFLFLAPVFAQSPATGNDQIIFGGDSDFPPNEFLDEQGRPAGFNVELTEALMRVMDLKCEIRLAPWGEVRRDLDAGKISSVLGMSYSAERSQLYDFSNPYLQLHFSVFIRKGTSPLRDETDLNGKEVIVHEGSFATEFVKSQYPGAKITIAKTPIDGLRLLASGKHDCYLLGRLQGYYLINKYRLKGLVAFGKPLIQTQYCYALHKGNAALLAKMNEGLSILKQTGEYQKIYEKWLGVLEPQPITLKRILRYAYGGLATLVVLLLISGIWTWSLRKTVEQRTGELKTELTERRHAEEALRESEQRYRMLVDNVDLGIMNVGEDYRIRTCNRIMSRLMGVGEGELTGRLCYEVLRKRHAACTDCPGTRALSEDQPVEVETELINREGREFPARLRAFPVSGADGKPSGFIEVLEDTTLRKQAEEERRRLEAQIQHTQKLESLGILAGGIAHDFNNLLTGILGNADLALGALPPKEAPTQRVQEIKRAALRASELTRQMLAYSGRGKFVIEPIDLNEMIEDMGHLLQVSISKKVSIRYRLTESLPPILGDGAQIRQVIMNLITNASDAIGDQNGMISLGTGLIWLDRSYLAQTYLQDGLKEGHYVFLEVTDSGCGMNEATMVKIFDPFFTTKFTGRGLGLATVLGIIRGHHGTVKIYSEPGKGTMFKVYFPCSEDSAGIPEKSEEPAAGDWTASGTILVVDDEEMVREVAQMMLESFGYTVLVAPDGVEGIRILEAEKEICAVLLDLTMPRLSGEETFREMHRLRPRLPIILVSGYNEQEVTDQFIGKGIAGFIQKPFQLAELVEKLRATIAKQA